MWRARELRRSPGIGFKDGSYYMSSSHSPPSVFTGWVSVIGSSVPETREQECSLQSRVTDSISMGFWCWRLLTFVFEKIIFDKVQSVENRVEPKDSPSGPAKLLERDRY